MHLLALVVPLGGMLSLLGHVMLGEQVRAWVVSLCVCVCPAHPLVADKRIAERTLKPSAVH